MFYNKEPISSVQLYILQYTQNILEKNTWEKCLSYLKWTMDYCSEGGLWVCWLSIACSKLMCRMEKIYWQWYCTGRVTATNGAVCGALELTAGLENVQQTVDRRLNHGWLRVIHLQGGRRGEVCRIFVHMCLIMCGLRLFG